MKNPDRVITSKVLEDRLDRLCHMIGGFVAKSVLHPLDGRIKALEEKIAKRGELKHAGTWHEGKTYAAGNLVTHQGGLWLVKRRTKKRPPNDSFVLIVKSGGARDPNTRQGDTQCERGRTCGNE